jgi:hypothetical protein
MITSGEAVLRYHPTISCSCPCCGMPVERTQGNRIHDTSRNQGQLRIVRAAFASSISITRAKENSAANSKPTSPMHTHPPPQLEISKSQANAGTWTDGPYYHRSLLMTVATSSVEVNTNEHSQPVKPNRSQQEESEDKDASDIQNPDSVRHL